jgi:hypothetical protein
MAEGAKRLDASAASTLSDRFSKAVNSLTELPGVKEALTKAGRSSSAAWSAAEAAAAVAPRGKKPTAMAIVHHL